MSEAVDFLGNIINVGDGVIFCATSGSTSLCGGVVYKITPKQVRIRGRSSRDFIKSHDKVVSVNHSDMVGYFMRGGKKREE